MRFILFLFVATNAVPCDPGWTLFNGNCYKHIVRDKNDRVVYDEAAADCAAKDSYLSPAATQEERDFLVALGSRPGNWDVKVDALKAFFPSPSLIGGGLNYMDSLILGAGRVTGKKQYYWFNTNSTWFGDWCPPDPDFRSNNFCLTLQFDPVCIWDNDCDNDYRSSGVPITKFLHYVCKKPGTLCKKGLEHKSDGSCGCKEGFLDITDLRIPEGKRYKKGEKCIPRNPCQNLTARGDLSIVFVVDSSQSIGAANWQNMVSFLKSGSRLLDNSINVGFVKFSTDVSSAGWLPRRWTKNEYLDDLPSSFDAGYTNTPAGLDAARELFQKIRADNRVAILITDGMPFVEGTLPKEHALDKTKEAAKELRRAGIDLVALGYGSELRNYQSYLKDLLPNSKRDYFQYDGEACDFKEMHMSFLLNKVCERFK